MRPGKRHAEAVADGIDEPREHGIGTCGGVKGSEPVGFGRRDGEEPIADAPVERKVEVGLEAGLVASLPSETDLDREMRGAPSGRG